MNMCELRNFIGLYLIILLYSYSINLIFISYIIFNYIENMEQSVGYYINKDFYIRSREEREIKGRSLYEDFPIKIFKWGYLLKKYQSEIFRVFSKCNINFRKETSNFKQLLKSRVNTFLINKLKHFIPPLLYLTEFRFL